VAAIGLVAVGALLVLTSRGEEPTDRRASMVVAPPTGGDATGAVGDLVRVSPPIDLAMAERMANAASLGRIPMPDSRDLASYRRVSSGEEISHAVLVYDDESEAAQLDSLAAPLLASALGLEGRALDLAGTQDARLWSGHGYQVVTFRNGGIVQLVATTSSEPAAAVALAEEARDRALALGPDLAATPTPGAP
jgi:hypothetical protein